MTPLELMANAKPRYFWDYEVVSGKGWHMYRADLHDEDADVMYVKFYDGNTDNILGYDAVTMECSRRNRIEAARTALLALAECELPRELIIRVEAEYDRHESMDTAFHELLRSIASSKGDEHE